MDYSFNGEIAAIYGVDEAVLLHNLYWWICKNEANGRHYHDGRSWTYNSMEAFAALFPFWSAKQVRRMITKLKENGALYVGNYNKNSFDRTQWYALSEDVLDVYRRDQNGQMDLTKRANGFDRTGSCSSEQIVNTDIKQESAKHKYGEFGWVLLTDEQHGKLLAELGKTELERCIRYIDESAQGTGNKNKWKDWSLVIRRCSRDKWGYSGASGRNELVQTNKEGDLARRALKKTLGRTI